MKTIEAIFDGKSFVPKEPVELPVGTEVSVPVPDHGYPGPRAGAPAQPLNPEEERVWREFLTAIRSAPPDPPTVEEAMRRIRGRS